MPKDEFDFDDPLELNGVALYTDEDTSRDMAECFAEEFLKLGYNHKQLLALFRNEHYIGMNMVLQNRGEPFVKEVIKDVCARWGRKIEWAPSAAVITEQVIPPQTVSRPAAHQHDLESSCTCGSGGCSSTPVEQTTALDDKLTDPLGNPVPKLNL